MRKFDVKKFVLMRRRPQQKEFYLSSSPLALLFLSACGGGSSENSSKDISYSGSGTTALTFAYIVQSGDDSSDLNFKSSSSLTFGSDGMIKDNALNTADLDLSSIALLSASATDIIVDGS